MIDQDLSHMGHYVVVDTPVINGQEHAGFRILCKADNVLLDWRPLVPMERWIAHQVALELHREWIENAIRKLTPK